jgi:hypothetical protein
MEPVNAPRTGRSILAVTTILTLALTVAPGAADPAAGRPSAHRADACGGGLSLAASDARPRQSRPVRFTAVNSSVPADAVVFFDFNYGDGDDDATSLPTAVHAYQEPGTYLAKVSVVTTCNTIVSSPDFHVVVGDGLPPAAAIGFPHANQTVHFGRAGLLLSGTAPDPSGLRRVELAIQILSVKRSAARARAAAAAAPKPGCYWYDGRVKLRAHACASPLFFKAHVSGSRWSFRMNPRSQIPPGVYTVRVRATDRAGNMTTVFSPKLGNILAFALVP